MELVMTQTTPASAQSRQHGGPDGPQATLNRIGEGPDLIGQFGDAHPAIRGLPGTKELWEEYVNRPQPQFPEFPPTLAVYRALSAEDSEDCEFFRCRYHAGLAMVYTPAMVRAHKAISYHIMLNNGQDEGTGQGVLIDGESTLGKTTIVKIFGRDHQRRLRRRFPAKFERPWDAFVPIVFTSMNAKATPMSINLALARFFGIPNRGTSSDFTKLTEAVVESLNRCETEAVIIDDIHFVRQTDKNGLYVNQHLKNLFTRTGATFVFVGINATAFLDEQMGGRLTPIAIRPFGASIQAGKKDPALTQAEAAEWAAIVKHFEDALHLYQHEPGSLVRDLLPYLLQRTSGRISSLSQLLRYAAVTAIVEGHERIDRALLDTITIDWVAQENYQTPTSRLTRKRG
jgi:hypothetical protein